MSRKYLSNIDQRRENMLYPSTKGSTWCIIKRANRTFGYTSTFQHINVPVVRMDKSSRPRYRDCRERNGSSCPSSRRCSHGYRIPSTSSRLGSVRTGKSCCWSRSRNELRWHRLMRMRSTNHNVLAMKHSRLVVVVGCGRCFSLP